MKKLTAMVLALVLIVSMTAWAEEETKYIEGVKWYGAWQMNFTSNGERAIYVMNLEENGWSGLTVIRSGKGTASYYPGLLIGDTLTTAAYTVKIYGLTEVLGQLCLDVEMSAGGQSFGRMQFFYCTKATVA